MIADAEGYAGYRMGAVSNKKKGIASCELSLLHFAIWSAVRIPVVVRQSNYCSKIDANCVSYLSHRWILTYRRIHHHSRVKLFGEEVPTSSQIPIVLLYGPPGSGKSFAMRMLAAQSGLQPWELKATALQERTREPVAVFQTILERMGRMEISAELKYATIDWQCCVRHGSWSQCPHCGSLMYNDQYFRDNIYQTRATTGKPHVGASRGFTQRASRACARPRRRELALVVFVRNVQASSGLRRMHIPA